MKIHLLPPLPPVPPAVPQRVRPSAPEAELTAEELIEIAERRRSQKIKRIVPDERGSHADGDAPDSGRKRRAVDVLV
jgi:hypothetical protein